jgi:hypothetical protein
MKRLLFFAFIGVLVGCAGSQTETTLLPKKHPSLSIESSSESKVLQFSHLTVSLEPALVEGTSYTAKGSLDLDPEKIFSVAVIYDFELQAIILDEDYKVVKKFSRRELNSKNANDSIPFEFNFRLQPNYRFITFNYSLKYHHAFT